MTDKELLELAAKAAGYTLTWGESFIVGDDEVDCTDIPYIKSNQQDEADLYWNPLEDDGDALRLAVKLDIEFYQANDEGMASYAAYWGVASHGDVSRLCVIEYHADLINNNDPYAATRRAIVRAAAEIGKEMK